MAGRRTELDRRANEDFVQREARCAEFVQVDGILAPDGRELARPTLRMPWHLLALSILLIVVAAAGAYAVASLGEKVYAARSEIAFDLRHLDWDSSRQFLATQVVIARSRSVLMPIASTFYVPILDLEKHLSVERVGDSSVLRFQYADASENRALDITRAITARCLAELTEFDQVAPLSRWILSEAFLLEDPISPQPLRAAALGALAGLILATGILLIQAQIWSAR